MPDDTFGASLGEDFASAWMGKSGNGVEPGDKIVGKIVNLSQGWSDQSEDYYPIVTVHNEETDTAEAIHCFWISLVNEFAKWKPEIGDRVAVLYKEDKPNKVKGRKDIKIFRVQIEGKTPDIFSQRSRPAPAPSSAGSDNENAEEDEFLNTL